MSRKFGRNYRITIDLGEGDPIVVTMPITVQFTVQRRQLSSLNTLSVDIYNLSERVRELIFQEFYGSERRKTIKIEAGYDTLSLLFEGDIFEAFSKRDGTNVITSIYSQSGSWDVSQKEVYTTLSKGQTVGDVMDFLIDQFDFVERGAVGEFTEVLQRPVTLAGNVWELLKKYSDNQVFIDNNNVYVLQRYETLEGEIPSINKDTGILDTPRRQGGFLQVTTLFEPRLIIGQYCDLKSDIAPIYNGDYKVVGLQHMGMMSEAVGGNLQTVVDLYIENRTFQTVIR